MIKILVLVVWFREVGIFTGFFCHIGTLCVRRCLFISKFIRIWNWNHWFKVDSRISTNSWSSSVSEFINPPLTSSRLGPNIFLSTLYSNTLSSQFFMKASAIYRYLNFATSLKLTIFVSWFCPAFCWRDVSIILGFISISMVFFILYMLSPIQQTPSPWTRNWCVTLV
jgi:hypothetical protein